MERKEKSVEKETGFSFFINLIKRKVIVCSYCINDRKKEGFMYKKYKILNYTTLVVSMSIEKLDFLYVL